MGSNHIFYHYNKPICEAVKIFSDINDFVLSFESLDIRHNFHFKPQTDFCFIENKPVLEFMGRFENFSVDVRLLATLLKLPADFQIPKLNVSGEQVPKNPLSSASKRVIFSIYKKDFELLEYCPE